MHRRNNWRAIAILLVCQAVVLALLLLCLDRYMTKNKIYEAELYGKEIVSRIELALSDSEAAAGTLESLYLEYGEEGYPHFNGTCARLMAKDKVISSLWLAPGGVVNLAYPTDVFSSVVGFDSSKDPEQADSTHLAVTSGKATVAGPHTQADGSVGFILREPMYVERDGVSYFQGFTVVVLDRDRFVEKITEGRTESEDGYRFGVWKDNNAYIVTDEAGYILKNGTNVISRRMDLPVNAPNETWHLSAEPVSGWSNFWTLLPFAIGAVVLLAVLGTVESEFLGRRESRLQAEKEEIAAAARSGLLAELSRSVREPAGEMLRLTRRAKEKAGDRSEVREDLDRIDLSGTDLLARISDALETDRIVSGQIRLEPVPCDLRAVMADLSTLLGGRAERKRLGFHVDGGALRDPLVSCDRARLERILLDLLRGSLDATAAGGSVFLRVQQSGAAQGGEAVYLFRVKDTSPMGNRKDDPRIAITRRLAELMGGTFTADSSPGKGTEFTVKLSLPVLEMEEPGDPQGTEDG